MASRTETLKVDGNDMKVYVSEPDAPGNYPGVLVIMEIFGVNGNIKGLTDKLAKEGYVALAPDLFHREGPDAVCDYTDPRAQQWRGNLRDDDIIKDLNASVDCLQGLSSVNSDRIGITGFCLGGRIAYLGAATNPAIKASAVYYGGRILQPFGEGPSPLDRTAGINGPVLGLFGEEDQNPSPDDVKTIEAELKKRGKTYEFHSYPNAGHGFICDERDSYRPEATQDAWAKMLAWFQKYLKA